MFLSLLISTPISSTIFFFFNDTATTEIYTLSLHDALPISLTTWVPRLDTSTVTKSVPEIQRHRPVPSLADSFSDRKSTRLNSSHQIISYAVFCLKKKKKELK